MLEYTMLDLTHHAPEKLIKSKKYQIKEYIIFNNQLLKSNFIPSIDV